MACRGRAGGRLARPAVAPPAAGAPSGSGNAVPAAVAPSGGTDVAPVVASAAVQPAAAPSPGKDLAARVKKGGGAATAAAGTEGTSGAAAASVGTGWRPKACPPPPEASPGPSTLSVTGPCTFQHRGTMSCESVVDDFFISTSRKAARGETLMVYINVENYKGPGSCKNAQMFVSVQDKTSI